MASCYRCGRPILETKYRLRRRVRTGGFERRRWGGKGKQVTFSANYGFRIVCTRCAHILDLQGGRVQSAENIRVLVALGFLIAVLIFKLIFE